METSSLITQIFLPLSLAFIMFSVGLELTIEDFKKVALVPKGFFIGALSQVLLLPAVAFFLLSLWKIDPSLAVGVMIISACPGGVTSNLMTYFARGDTALSVSLTAIISLLTVFSLPLIVSFSMSHFMGTNTSQEISISKTIYGVFAITTLPVIMGMFVKNRLATIAIKLETNFRLVSSVLFIIILIGAVTAERDNILTYFKQAGLLTLCLNLTMMTLAFLIANMAKVEEKQKKAIVFECGLQNGTLAIFVAVTIIGSNTMMIPGAIYSLLMFPTAIVYLLAVIFKKRKNHNTNINVHTKKIN